MKADFEKGTKVCGKCKRELPIEMFYKDVSRVDGIRKCNLCICEKECMIETEARDCFGAYDGDIECECCDSKEACENVKNYNIDDEEDVL